MDFFPGSRNTAKSADRVEKLAGVVGAAESTRGQKDAEKQAKQDEKERRKQEAAAEKAKKKQLAQEEKERKRRQKEEAKRAKKQGKSAKEALYADPEPEADLKPDAVADGLDDGAP